MSNQDEDREEILRKMLEGFDQDGDVCVFEEIAIPGISPRVDTKSTQK